MKPSPPPEVSGNTDWDRLDSAVRAAFRAPKDSVIKKPVKASKKTEPKARRSAK